MIFPTINSHVPTYRRNNSKIDHYSSHKLWENRFDDNILIQEEKVFKKVEKRIKENNAWDTFLKLTEEEKLIEKNILTYLDHKPFASYDVTFTDISTKSNSSLGNQKFKKNRARRSKQLNSIIEERPWKKRTSSRRGIRKSGIKTSFRVNHQ